MTDMSAVKKVDTNMLVLKRSEISSLLTCADYITAMEKAFRNRSEGKALPPGLMHTDVENGEFHIKSGGLEYEQTYFALKANGGFFGNSEKFDLPNIIGLILLFDGANGRPLAVMDSTNITSKRTAATTTLAAKYLARKDSETVLICGSGNQARFQLRALVDSIPTIKKAYVWGIIEAEVKSYAREMSEELGLPVHVAPDLKSAAPLCDIIVTCTPSKAFYLKREHVRPGTFVAAVGADSPDKQELDPQLIAGCKLVVDVLEQCRSSGELHHALEAGLMKAEDVYCELGDVIAGKMPARVRDEDIVIFDTTGSAIQDTAAAVAAYEKAVKNKVGLLVNPYE